MSIQVTIQVRIQVTIQVRIQVTPPHTILTPCPPYYFCQALTLHACYICYLIFLSSTYFHTYTLLYSKASKGSAVKRTPTMHI